MCCRVRCLLGLLVLLAGGMALRAAPAPAETKAFNAAALSFQGGWWERANRELGDFTQHFPQSELLPKAVLLMAQARINLKNFDGAIEVLQAHQAAAGPLADDYLFWLAEAHYQKGELAPAADLFSQFARTYAKSPRVLEAVVTEAAARSRLEQWPQVGELLGGADSAFRRLAPNSPGALPAIQGWLLLGESLFRQGRFADAEKALAPLASATLADTQAWKRDYLLAQIQRAAGHLEEALATARNLTKLTNQPAMMAEGVALQAKILEDQGQVTNAIAVWQLNVTANAPVERQREALLRVSDLWLTQNRVGEALQTLGTFLSTATNSPAADIAWLAVGELRLRRYLQTNAPAGTNVTASVTTNLLADALGAFDTVLAKFPGTSLTGRTQLGRGWCFWFEQRPADAVAAFGAAVNALPASYERSVAQFKLADALLAENNFAGALTNYDAVVASGEALPAVRTNLVERALYQALRAATQGGDSAAANRAMARLLNDFPNGFLAERSLIAYGNTVSGTTDPAEARTVFEAFLQKLPASDIAPAVRLAVARTYEQERDWPKAEAAYATWLDAYPDNPARPRAEYYRALATARSGDETNALTLFTNYVARFPTNEFAPLARLWVADHYWRQDDYVNAELNYQLLFKTHPASELRYEAQLMAGRAAFARRPEEALSYFTNLTSDPTCPPTIDAQALFATGDVYMSLPAADNAPVRTNYFEAAARFSKVAQRYPNSPLAILAEGKAGECYLQLGGGDPVQYEYAKREFRKVLGAPGVDVATRSDAEVGLGLAFESQAQQATGTNQTQLAQQALDHYLSVVYGSLLGPGEKSDPLWVKEAGLKALRVAESLQAWDQIVKLCDKLSEMLPPLRPQLEKKRARAVELSGKSAD
jgi:TolA-binding protein